MLTFKCSMLTRELFLPFPIRCSVAEGSGILMIRLPFTFSVADREADIINVGNLSPDNEITVQETREASDLVCPPFLGFFAACSSHSI